MTIRRAVLAIRAVKLPDPKFIPNSGSFFKNVMVSPEEKKKYRAEYPEMPIFKINGHWEISAGWLIEQCGLKGRKIFGFEVSPSAALILINRTATTYAELDQAREKIISAVQEKFGIILQQEPEEI